MVVQLGPFVGWVGAGVGLGLGGDVGDDLGPPGVVAGGQVGRGELDLDLAAPVPDLDPRTGARPVTRCGR